MRRKFTNEQKEDIIKRDGCCVLCGTNNISTVHHCFYGTRKPAGWKKEDDINGDWNGIAICFYDHQGFHHTGRFYNGKSIKENRKYLESLAQQRYDNRNTDQASFIKRGISGQAF